MKMNVRKSKQTGLAVAVAFAFAAFMPTLSFAAADAAVGDFVTIGDGPGSPGGEFKIDNLTNGAGVDFISFCLERDEYLSFGPIYRVSDVSINAIDGGVGGPSPDPISYATAYLYSQYRAGTLGSYLGDAASANSLQNAIWFLEDEVGIGALDAQAVIWKDLGLAMGTGYYGVAVMNIESLDERPELKQSQLMLTPIPEPETYAMLLAGLGLMGFVARRRQRKLAAA